MTEKQKGGEPFYLTRKVLSEFQQRFNLVNNRLNLELPSQYEDAAHADWKENSPKDVLDHESGLLRAEVLTLQDRLRRAVVIDDMDVDEEVVGPGRYVEIESERGEGSEHLLLSFTDINRRHLSLESPVGKAVIGKRANDIGVVEMPGGKVEYVFVRRIRRYIADETEDIIEEEKNYPQDKLSASQIFQLNTSKSASKPPIDQPSRTQNKSKIAESNPHKSTSSEKFKTLLSVIKAQNLPISTHSIRPGILPDGITCTQETLIFSNNGSLVKVILTTTNSESSVRAYRHINKKWDEIPFSL